MMYSTTALGVRSSATGLEFLQTITASNVGSLLTAGIGPIVLASIFLQLFNGAGLLNLDLKKKEDKSKFVEVQKILAIVLAFVEAFIFVATARVFIQPLFPGLGEALLADGGIEAPFTMAFVVAQIALGSVVVLYLDELVSKYGIGSGISLFIAAGVAFAIVSGLFALLFTANTSVVAAIEAGGATAVADAIVAILPFIFTILVFMAVVYAESIKVEIPIAFERVRGLVPKLPLKFFYVSNIPVIFASALIINVQIFAGGLLTGAYWDSSTGAATTDILENGYDFDSHGILPLIGFADSSGQMRDGLLSMLMPIHGAPLQQTTAQHFDHLLNYTSPIFGIPEWVHALMYVLLLAGASVLFGLFWVELSNMDAKSVAGQLTGSGIQIPGFRRDPRMLETILNKHIFPLTVMGSFAVGLLAGIADLTGALGTGTGILLTVGILYRMYEQLEQMNMFEMYPSLGSFIGNK